MLLADCDFEFFVDLQKSEGATEERRLVRGLASCEALDAQGEVVVQKGMDCSYLVQRGYVNWDHLAGPENLLGWPTHAEVAKAEDHPVLAKAGVAGLGLYIEAELQKAGRIPRADAAWTWLNHPRPGAPLAWSIQGKVVDRDGHRITKSLIRHLAITHQPILAASFAEIAKSLAAGDVASTESARPLTREALNGRVTRVLWGDCRKSCYDHQGRFRKGISGALEHLTACHGEPITEAHAFLKALITSRVTR